MTPRPKQAEAPLGAGVSGGTNIRPQLMQYFEEHAEKTVYLSDIMDALGESLDRRVQQGVNNLIHADVMTGVIERIVAGQAWVYRPNARYVNAKNDKRIFAEVGKTKDGGLILEADDETLWKATQL